MKRDTTASLSLVAATLLCGLCAACTERQLITHPDEGVAEDDFSGGEGSTSAGSNATTAEGGDGSNLGNFPEPAMSECGSLPPGVVAIPGLATAWAVSGPAPGMDFDGAPYPDDQIRLRFSDYGAGCDEAFDDVSESCVDAWSFSLSFFQSTLVPGVYDLATMPSLYPEMYASMGFDGECAGGEVGGGGSAPGAEPQGTLEIFSATDDCIVGELSGLQDGFGDLDVDRNGGFVAMRCQSACVPMPANTCGQ